jgi:hypothetical protein
MLNARLRENSADPTAHVQLTLDEQLQVRLHRHVQRLQCVLPVISVAVLALRRQRAELDEDIALVLSNHAGDPLDVEVGQLQALLSTITGDSARKERAESSGEGDQS